MICAIFSMLILMQILAAIFCWLVTCWFCCPHCGFHVFLCSGLYKRQSLAMVIQLRYSHQGGSNHEDLLLLGDYHGLCLPKPKTQIQISLAKLIRNSIFHQYNPINKRQLNHLTKNAPIN